MMRRPVRTIWHGIRMNALRNVLNSMPKIVALSSRWRSLHRPGASVGHNAHQAFRFQANDVISMYAQLLSNVSTGAVRARTPL